MANGVSPLFAAFFFVWFVGVLYGLLRRAEGEGAALLSSCALAGGVMFIALQGAGLAVEIAHPATLTRFGAFRPDAQLAFLSLTLSAWLYHSCQVGTSVMVSATSLVALRRGILPRWLALVGFVVALLALLHFVLPLAGAIAGLAWVAVVAILMLAGSTIPSARARSLR